MPKFVIGLFAVILSTVAGADLVSAGPGDPLDGTGHSSCIGGTNAGASCVAVSECPGGGCGGLAGFAPPTQGGLSCTRYMNKRVTVMPLKCTMACAIDFAGAVSKGLTFDYDYCEQNWPQFSCQDRYAVALQKLDQGTCMNCLDDPARQALYPAYSDVVATARDQIYCDNNPANTPFPDGHGFVSGQRDVVNCQNKLMRNLMKAAKCLNLHCHAKLADLKYWNKPIRTTNAQCEDADATKSCKAHFDLANSKLSGCPACVDTAAIWTSFQNSLDRHNGDIYCSDN
jgi:hypothetical protein